MREADLGGGKGRLIFLYLTHRQDPCMAEAHPGCVSEGDAEGHEALGEPQRASGPGGRHRGQAFGEDAASAVGILAKPLADAGLKTHAVVRPREVGQGALIVTVDALRWGGAQRTGRRGRSRTHGDGKLRRPVIDRTGLEAQGGGIR